MKQEPMKILVVDDEVKLAEVIRSYLEQEGFGVFCAADCESAYKLFERHRPDLIVLDLMLPDMSGEDFCKSIRSRSRVPIIMLTAKVEEASILNGLEIGADDYVTKPFSVKQLVARVKALLRRSGDDLPLASAFDYFNGDLQVDTLKREVRKSGELVNLTPNEYKLLLALISYPNKVFTRDELITIALGDDYGGFSRTVDSHIKNLRQKIESDSKEPKYVLTVHGVGYRFGGEPS